MCHENLRNYQNVKHLGKHFPFGPSETSSKWKTLSARPATGGTAGGPGRGRAAGVDVGAGVGVDVGVGVLVMVGVGVGVGDAIAVESFTIA